MAKLYVLQKGQKSVKYGKAIFPLLRYQKYKIMFYLCAIVSIFQSVHIFINK